MYDWIQRAPVKYENYSYNDNKSNGFGIRTLPPKPASSNINNQQPIIKKSVSTDKSLNIHGHNLLSTNQHHKPSSGSKSLQKLLNTQQEENHSKKKPVPKQRKATKLKDEMHDIEETSNNYEIFIEAQQKAYFNEKANGLKNESIKHPSDYENYDEDEYDNFKYIDHCYTGEKNLYDNYRLPNKENNNHDMDLIDGKHIMSYLII